MSDRICSVDGCERPEYVRAVHLCSLHYNRNHRPVRQGKPGSMYGWGWREKLRAVVPCGLGLDECWPVTHSVDGDGYAHLHATDTTETLVHRLVAMEQGWVIPPKWEVDHLCRVRNCANPRHLEVVPKSVNRARSVRPKRTHCVHGHDKSDAYACGSCRTCTRDKGRLRKRGANDRCTTNAANRD